jgi:CTP synthase
MQVMCIEFARHVFDSQEPNSTEFNLFTRYPVIDLLPEQRDIEDKGATMRLGVYPCQLRPATRAGDAYDEPIVFERHRHRYEFNNTFREALTNAGLVFSGTSPDGHLVEFVELPRDVHPFFVGTQAHPEFRSRPTRAHPLFRGFVTAAVAYAQAGAGLLPWEEGAEVLGGLTADAGATV